MKHIAIHHIHVRYGKDIFTISHDKESISLFKLADIISEIIDFCINKKGEKNARKEK